MNIPMKTLTAFWQCRTASRLRAGELLLTGCSGSSPTAVNITDTTTCLPLTVEQGLPLPAQPSTGHTVPQSLHAQGTVRYVSSLPSANPSGQRRGTLGDMTCRYQEAQHGEGTLLMEYRRSWERTSAPAKTFRCPVKVSK